MPCAMATNSTEHFHEDQKTSQRRRRRSRNRNGRFHDASSSSNRVVHHSTVINAPANVVWECLSDTGDWYKWNKWVRFVDADSNSSSQSESSSNNYLRLSMEGNGKWQRRKRKFEFTCVNRNQLLFEWTTKLGFGSSSKSTNSIRLIPLGSKQTRIEHTHAISSSSSPSQQHPQEGSNRGEKQKIVVVFEFFQRLCVIGSCGDRKLSQKHHCHQQHYHHWSQRHCFYINEALKHHVESYHFQSLLFTLSTRQMTTAGEGDNMMKSDMTMGTTSVTSASGNGSSELGYWETPSNLRKELISCYI